MEKSRGGRAHIKQSTGERNKDTHIPYGLLPGDMMHTRWRNSKRFMMLTAW